MWSIIPSKRIWLNDFLALITRYSSTVAGLFYGHTQMDELRMLYDSSGHSIQVAISCLSISVDHHNNTGFKLVRFDPSNKLPVDFTTYYSNKLAEVWGDKKYTYSDIFRTAPDSSIFSSLKDISVNELETRVNTVFNVINGKPSISVRPGLSVHWYQQTNMTDR